MDKNKKLFIAIICIIGCIPILFIIAISVFFVLKVTGMLTVFM